MHATKVINSQRYSDLTSRFGGSSTIGQIKGQREMTLYGCTSDPLAEDMILIRLSPLIRNRSFTIYQTYSLFMQCDGQETDFSLRHLKISVS